MLSRLARWWLARTERRERVETPPEAPRLSGECVCGKVVHGEDLHLVVVLSDDDARLGIDQGDGGGSAMSADFCAEHCPGGCVLGCVGSSP